MSTREHKEKTQKQGINAQKYNSKMCNINKDIKSIRLLTREGISFNKNKKRTRVHCEKAKKI